MSVLPQLRLKKSNTRFLDRRHPWIFSGALQEMREVPEEGSVVNVCDSQGDFVARGYYEIGSIAVRILTFDPDEEIDEEYWKRRLERALLLRRALGLCVPRGSYRLVHGEGDFLPGLIIDIYGDTAVMQAHTVGIHRVRQLLADTLMELYGSDLTCVYYKSETTLPYKSDTDEREGVLSGSLHEPDCMEYGIRFVPDILKGQKTGFFIDQRENRKLLERYSLERKVLNVFCYTGGFSLYALRGGAQSVVSIDSSAKAIELCRTNVSLNFDAETVGKHSALAEDAFKYLEEMPTGKFDLIVLDPPAFAKHRSVVNNALQGYRKINTEALKKITPGGILFTFSCSQAITPQQFRQAVFTSSIAAQRKVRILHILTQPADHPISMYHPEGEYLKGLVLYVE